jgi:hypothetical protein
MCGGGSSGAHTPPKISSSNCDARTNSTRILRERCFWMAMLFGLFALSVFVFELVRS